VLKPGGEIVIASKMAAGAGLPMKLESAIAPVSPGGLQDREDRAQALTESLACGARSADAGLESRQKRLTALSIVATARLFVT
jgi:hypothetical protein